MTTIEAVQDPQRSHIWYVQSFNPQTPHIFYTVDLQAQTCSCERWTYTANKCTETFLKHKHAKIAIQANEGSYYNEV